MSNTGRYIARYRKEQSLTQEQLGQRLNVTRQTVSSWENGRTLPDIDMLAHISECLGVTIEQLIYGRDANETPRNTTPYLRLCIVTAVVMVLSAAVLIILKRVFGEAYYSYSVFALLLHTSVLRQLLCLSGGVFLLSLVSMWADIALKSRVLRSTIASVGGAAVIAYIVFAIMVMFPIQNIGWMYYYLNFIISAPYTLSAAGALLFLGLNRPAKALRF